jgi:glycerophosphoryl diester phosphodiesterase
VHTWTVNEPDEIRQFLGSGIASLTTDVPDVALGLRAEMAQAATSA